LGYSIRRQLPKAPRDGRPYGVADGLIFPAQPIAYFTATVQGGSCRRLPAATTACLRSDLPRRPRPDAIPELIGALPFFALIIHFFLTTRKSPHAR